MSVADRLSSSLYHGATIISALVLVLLYGVSWHLGWPLVLFALIVDLNRFRSKTWPAGLSFRLGDLHFPVRLYIKPLWVLRLIVATIAALLFLYLALPDICLRAFNTWIETNISIVRWQLQDFTSACVVPHGTVLRLSQAILPVVQVASLAMIVTSARFEPEKFLNETSQHVRLRVTENLNHKGLIFFLVFYWAFVAAVAALPLTPDHVHMTKSFHPQSVWFTFVFWQGMFYFPLMFAYMSADVYANLRNLEKS